MGFWYISSFNFPICSHSQLDWPTQQTFRASCSLIKYFHFDHKQKVKIPAKTLLHLIIALPQYEYPTKQKWIDLIFSHLTVEEKVSKIRGKFFEKFRIFLRKFSFAGNLGTTKCQVALNSTIVIAQKAGCYVAPTFEPSYKM